MRFCARSAHPRASQSTPRSPRATITASAASRMPSRFSSACGFSSLTITKARPGGDGPWPGGHLQRALHERQSRYSRCRGGAARMRGRARSFFVSAGGSGNTTSGTLTPLRSESTPLEDHSVMRYGRPGLPHHPQPQFAIIEQQVVPMLTASMISGCGRQTRRVSPGAGFMSREANSPPACSCTRPDWKFPHAQFRAPAHRQESRSAARIFSSTARIISIRAAWSSCAPWEKFSRNTSAPAWNSSQHHFRGGTGRPQCGDDLRPALAATAVVSSVLSPQLIRIARISFTFVIVGPVITRSLSARKTIAVMGAKKLRGIQAKRSGRARACPA